MAGRMSMEEAYRVLGLNKNATKEEVMKARKELLMKWHPDVAKSSDATRKAQEINEAYAVIKDNNFVYTPSSNNWNTQGNPYGQRGYGYYQGANNQNSSQNGYSGQSYDGGGYYRGPYNQGNNQSQSNGQGYYGGFGGARRKAYSPFSFIRSFFFIIILMNLISGLFSGGRSNNYSSFYNVSNNYTSEAQKDYYGVATEDLDKYNLIIDFSDIVREGDDYIVTAANADNNKNIELYFNEDTPIAVVSGRGGKPLVFMYMKDLIENLEDNTLYVEDHNRAVYLNEYNFTGTVYAAEDKVENVILYYSTSSSKSIWYK